MDRLGSQAHKLVEAAALGLLVTAPLYIAPASIASRLDAWVFDTWSRIAPAPASALFAVAEIDTPAELGDLATAASELGVELLVTTVAPLADVPKPLLVGPTEIATDQQRVRSTGWDRGGPLVFAQELDGVVRRDAGPHGVASAQPSLAADAAAFLSREIELSDARARPLLHFAARDTLRQWSAVAKDPVPSGVRALVAGPAGASHSTPMGVVTTPELVALALNAHLTGNYIGETAWTTRAAWFTALALVIAIGLLARSRAHVLVFALCTAAAFVAASAAAFMSLQLWLPIAGPLSWLALSSALLTARHSPQAQRVAKRAPGSDGDRIARARQIANGGQLNEAWALYRSVPASPELLPELYDLARALQTRDAADEAAELFHRIAQTNSNFRDVAHRLVHARDDAADAADMAEEMPKEIGRYQLLEHIGRGAMGNVYLGRDPLINRIVALKTIDLSIGYDNESMETTTESFLREATIAGNLSHPNIVTIYDVGEAAGLAYIAMEYVRGHHLSEFTAAARLLPVATTIELIARAADALDYAHRHNIVHRDIKPANIMYDWISNSLKITDFGVAKLIDANRTRTDIVLGTPAYMSPEQLEGRNVNGHTDLFALGVSLYQLLTGQLPFRGTSMTNLMFVIANEPHESVTRLRGDLPTWLDVVVDRALAKDPTDRFQSGAEMAAALRHAA